MYRYYTYHIRVTCARRLPFSNNTNKGMEKTMSKQFVETEFHWVYGICVFFFVLVSFRKTGTVVVRFSVFAYNTGLEWQCTVYKTLTAFGYQ